jgi:UDP-N-acetylglucosamine 2-epimerase (non-hydrolysing)
MRGRSPILAVCGTRPEAIKLAPVVLALRERGHPVIVLATGQHPALATDMLREAGLEADIDLGVHQAGASPPQLLAALILAMQPVLAACRPSLVVVQGDTVSAMAAALAANYARVPVAHVEAGLRTHNRDEPFPEELHRCLIAPLANLHFAPTRRAAAALAAEGIDPASVHICGNSGIDAVLATARRLAGDRHLQASMLERFAFVAEARRPLVLATVHRRENIGARLSAIAAALGRLAGFCAAEIVLPLHPNPAVAGKLREKLGGLAGVHLLPAVDHAAMVWLMQHCRLLLTDSGGLQEEAPALGLRVLVLRETTERQEAVDCGAASLVPLRADAIVAATRSALREPLPAPCFPFGDGLAAPRIAEVIGQWLGIPLPESAVGRSLH